MRGVYRSEQTVTLAPSAADGSAIDVYLPTQALPYSPTRFFFLACSLSARSVDCNILSLNSRVPKEKRTVSRLKSNFPCICFVLLRFKVVQLRSASITLIFHLLRMNRYFLTFRFLQRVLYFRVLILNSTSVQILMLRFCLHCISFLFAEDVVHSIYFFSHLLFLRPPIVGASCCIVAASQYVSEIRENGEQIQELELGSRVYLSQRDLPRHFICALRPYSREEKEDSG